ILFFASLIGASTRALPLNRESMMPDSVELRKRAEWYREFAERAGVPWIWEARLKTAEKLEAEPARVESRPTLEQERDDPPSPLHLVGRPNAPNPSSHSTPHVNSAEVKNKRSF